MTGIAQGFFRQPRLRGSSTRERMRVTLASMLACFPSSARIAPVAEAEDLVRIPPPAGFAPSADGVVAYPGIIVAEPSGGSSAYRREQLIERVRAALRDAGASDAQVWQFWLETGSYTWYTKVLRAARRWVTVRSPGDGDAAPLPAPAADLAVHDQRLDDGWAVWAADGEQAELPGRNQHAHAHASGPFFAHRHPGGDIPHDHRQESALIPVAVMREYWHSREGRPS